MSFGDVQRLRAFALVLDLGSVSAAASVLGYTQSAVSQQLAALEREAGMALVDRSQRPLRATRAGELLRPHVDRVLAVLGGAEATLEDLRGGAHRIRLAAFTSALSSFVPRAVRDLRRAHAQDVVEVLQLETREAVELLRSGSCDLAVVHYLPGVAGPETVSVADLEGEPLILPRRDTPAARFRSVVEHLCSQEGFEPQVAYELDDLPAVQAFVAAGIAIVPMHGLTLRTIPPGATARPLAERPAGSRAIEALAPAEARTPVVDDLLQRLTDAARSYALSASSDDSRSRASG